MCKELGSNNQLLKCGLASFNCSRQIHIGSTLELTHACVTSTSTYTVYVTSHQ